MTETVQPRTYYSRSQGLALHPKKGARHIMEGGLVERVGEVIAEFAPLGGIPSAYGLYGSYTTDDPEVIAFMEARAAIPGSDVMTAATFNDVIIPDAQKVDALRGKLAEQSREISENNRIIAELQRQQTAKVQQTVKQ